MSRYIDDEINDRLDYTQGPQRVFAGVIASAAVDFADRVSVTIPGRDGGYLRWEDVRWNPRIGNELPHRGDECVVVLDDNNELWIVAWWSGNPLVVEDKRFIDTAGNPAFENGTSNLGGSWEHASFFKDPYSVVHLQGLVIPGTITLPMFTLPEGYRPTARLILTVWTGDDPVAGRLDILPDGSVEQINGADNYLSLSGVSFRV